MARKIMKSKKAIRAGSCSFKAPASKREKLLEFVRLLEQIGGEISVISYSNKNSIDEVSIIASHEQCRLIELYLGN